VDHDISMLVPEIWCRMRPDERDPEFLLANGYLEKVEDFPYEGRTVRASRLGFRITARFAETFLGRIFETPDAIFTPELLRPEQQGENFYVAGVDSIVEAQTRVALHYFDDGSIDAACPPLRVLLHIMAHGQFEGKDERHPDVRAMFTRESLLESEWYRERLATKQSRDTALWKEHNEALEAFRVGGIPPENVDIEARLGTVREQLSRVSSAAYLDELSGTIGADPFHKQLQRQ
jgi:phosphoenolpyruvate carboxykinase (diphosphate)